MIDTLLWAEHYRPKTVDDCILPEATKKMVKEFIDAGEIPHFIFAGAAGCGKTSLIKAIVNEFDADLLYINASMETSIDIIRDKVISFSSSVSLSGSKKVVLFDEAEGMSAQAANSLKSVYEQFPTTRFMMTTNNLSKIIEPLKSRSVVVEFKIDPKEKPKLAAQMFKRCLAILKENSIEADPKLVAEIVNKFFPDFRKTLNELQRHSSSGKIDSSILLGENRKTYSSLFSALKEKDFKTMRQWVGENASDDSSLLFKELYENAFDIFEPQSVPNLIVLLADYQFKGTHAVDPQINLAACLTEIMASCKFR